MNEKPVRVLVVVASRHGATAEIGAAVARDLGDCDAGRAARTTHAGVLRTRPTWLFSSGPIGEPPFPADEPHDVPPLMQLIGARGLGRRPERPGAVLRASRIEPCGEC